MGPPFEAFWGHFWDPLGTPWETLGDPKGARRGPKTLRRALQGATIFTQGAQGGHRGGPKAVPKRGPFLTPLFDPKCTPKWERFFEGPPLSSYLYTPKSTTFGTPWKVKTVLSLGREHCFHYFSWLAFGPHFDTIGAPFCTPRAPLFSPRGAKRGKKGVRKGV